MSWFVYGRNYGALPALTFTWAKINTLLKCLLISHKFINPKKNHLSSPRLGFSQKKKKFISTVGRHKLPIFFFFVNPLLTKILYFCFRFCSPLRFPFNCANFWVELDREPQFRSPYLVLQFDFFIKTLKVTSNSFSPHLLSFFGVVL